MRVRSRLALSLIATAFLLIGVAVVPGPHAAPADAAEAPAADSAFRPHNVVLITLDTTRADHLSCYGYPLLTSPNIDGLAVRGVRFSRASSIVPLTGPGHATMMTGLVPRDHGAVRNGVRMRDEIPTMAQALSELGFRTAAFVSGWTLRARITGLDRGFDHYDDEMTDRYQLVNNQRWGNETTELATAWLAQNAGRSFFLWLHLFDPHDPYKDHGIDIPLTPGREMPERDDKLADYDQEIAFADRQIGRLLAALEAAGVTEKTLVVLTADHGEAFGEHGERGHGRHLYETTQHVPFIVTHPSLPQGLVSDVPASTQDVYATILGMLGVPVSPAIEAVGLHEAVHSPASHAGREIYMETFHGARRKFWHIFGPSLTGKPLAVAVRRGDWKTIFELKSGKTELYNLARDPDELADLAEEQPYRLRHVLPRLTAYADKEWKAAAEPVALTDEDRKKLESLGYTH